MPALVLVAALGLSQAVRVLGGLGHHSSPCYPVLQPCSWPVGTAAWRALTKHSCLHPAGMKCLHICC